MLAASSQDPQDNFHGSAAIPLGVAAPDDDFVNIGSMGGSGPAEKNCSACTMLNPIGAVSCSICGSYKFDNWTEWFSWDIVVSTRSATKRQRLVSYGRNKEDEDKSRDI